MSSKKSLVINPLIIGGLLYFGTSFLLLSPWIVSHAQEITRESVTSIRPEEPSSEEEIPQALIEGQPVLDGVKGAYMLDANNGQILYSYQSQDETEVASMSQLLLLYLVYQAIDEGALSEDKEVWISDQAYALSQDYNLPNVPLRQDLPYRLRDLMEAVIVNSSMGASQALAEELAGSETKALQLMKQQLQEWQLNGDGLINVTGLASDYLSDDSKKASQAVFNRLSAEATATIAYHLINEYPQVIESSQIYKKLFQEGTSDAFEMTNANLLLENADSLYANKGIDGLKKSQVAEEDHHLVITSEKNDLRLIIVLLGVEKDEKLYQLAKTLDDYGHHAFRSEKVITQHALAQHVDAVRVEKGRVQQANLIYQSDLQVVVPIIDTAPRLIYHFQPNKELEKEGLQAPIKAGTAVGILQVDIADYPLPIIPSGKGNQVTVIVKDAIEEANFFEKTWQEIGEFTDQSWKKTRKFFMNLFN